MSESLKPEKQPEFTDSKYVRMSLASHDIPPWWGRLSYMFSWILIQGYVIFPSTFIATTLGGLPPPPVGSSVGDRIKRELFFLAQHVPLFWIAWSGVIVGGLGMFFCLMRWRNNYIWGLKEIVSPGLYAASTGLVSAASNIWGVEKGKLSAASKLTLFVNGGATAFFIILWIIYKPILIRSAKKKHDNEVGLYLGLGKHGEGIIQKDEPVEGKATSIANMLLT